MGTIGEAIEKKAEEHIRLYEDLRRDEQFFELAAALAKHDLIMAKYINEQALVKLEEYIEQGEPLVSVQSNWPDEDTLVEFTNLCQQYPNEARVTLWQKVTSRLPSDL